MENKQELKKCPFCGGEAEIVRDWIRCIKCGVWTDVPKEEDGLPKSIQAWNTRAKQVDERMEFDVDAVEKMIVNSNHACCMYPKDLAQAIVNTFKPKVEKKSIKELQDKLVKFFSIESLTLNESTIVHLVAMISQHSYYADKPKVDQWISVEDRLPEKPEHAGQVITLLITDGNVVTTTRFTYTGVWESYRYLTHWQPLPEAPKINKEGTQNANT